MTKIMPALLFFSLTASASDLVYCPPLTECVNGRCTFEQDANNYWSAITNPCDPEHLRDGEYPLTYVSAPYRVQDGGYAICVYTHPESRQTLMLRARLNARLVVFQDEYSAWRREESWGECRPTPLRDCPLQMEDPDEN